MHRDKKIGFALGILILGIVGAFFFRNEPDPFAELPPLDDPAALDAEIAEKPNAPYTEQAQGQAAPNTSVSLPKSPWELPEAYRSSPPAPVGGEGLSALPGAPDPISLAEPIPLPENPSSKSIKVGNPFGELPQAPIPNRDVPLPGNESWTSVPAVTPADPPPPELVQNSPAVSNSPPATPTMYKVQQGDTLSVLAEKHLGSSRRFMEIYEANRDKLKNPNDIKMGMTIRIPPRVKFKETLPAMGSSPPSEKSTTILPPPEEAQRFSPFSRSPLAPVLQ